MSENTTNKLRDKKIKGIFIIALAIAVTLAYNAVLIHQERSHTVPEQTAESVAPDEDIPTYTLAEVAERDTSDNCWMAAYGNVYDLTEYVAQQRHPGGQNQLLSGCGNEVTEVFDRIHSTRAQSMLADFKIGFLE